MAIRRVTGAVSPSELIFADANALGATYDGSGTTIERGETFTLPAGGTTAVSNGALRLEALKGDCTITNNGNSTLTNASGIDGTIVMRSGASDFPAFVRNSSMGSMSIPAREDFTGSLTNSSVTFPAGHIIGRLAHKVDRTRRKYASRTQHTWYDDYTELNFTVTPSYSSSKLWFNGMVSFGCNASTNSGSLFFQYIECDADGNNCDETNQINGDDAQNYGSHPCFAQYRWSHSSSGMEYLMVTRPINAFMDSFSGTKTYKLRYRIQESRDVTFNRDGSDSSDTNAGSHSPSGLSMIQVFEIAQ